MLLLIGGWEQQKSILLKVGKDIGLWFVCFFVFLFFLVVVVFRAAVSGIWRFPG